jgi:leader peptidase (prepilin peptidase)/N-methyltransferase
VNTASIALAFADAVMFAGAGWVGVLLSDVLYGTLAAEADGPETIIMPLWVFLAVTACIGGAIGMHGATPAHTALMLVVVAALAVCASTDLRAGMIPDAFTLLPLAIVLGYAAIDRSWVPLIGAAFALVPFALLAALSRGHGMGWGDVKLATLGGALLGMSGLTVAVAFAAIAVLIVSLARGRFGQSIAFGPYLAVAIGAALTLGPWV